MRSLILMFVASGIGVLASAPALAQDSAFAKGTALQLAGPYESQQQPSDDDEDTQDRDREDRDRDRERDRPMTREEIRERKRVLREQERELEERERGAREERLHHVMYPRAWIGAGAGIGWATVDVPCSFGGGECTKGGTLGTYNANVTITGPHSILRVRGVREQDKGDNQRTPFEEAALVGTRFGHGDWYGLLGYGRILHPHDDYTKGDAHGLAWEIIFAPSSYGPLGMELSFQGNQGADVSYFTFNIGARFGMLR